MLRLRALSRAPAATIPLRERVLHTSLRFSLVRASSLLRSRTSPANSVSLGVNHRWLSSSSENKEVEEVETEEVPKYANIPEAGSDEIAEIDDDVAQTETPATVNVSSEVATGESETLTFQAETKKILDIVAHSLYTDKEVFLRELISNASDALEKASYMQKSGSASLGDIPLEIRITTDEQANTLTIQDTGIGMTAEEMKLNLGTIARSGSKIFAELNKDGASAPDIIGQFGVGFYSSFMVAHSVDVFSQSVEAEDKNSGHFWSSDGSGSYKLSGAEGLKRGTKIIAHLKENCKEFGVKHMVEGIVKKYSNFVGFPIFLNGNKLNTVKAIWKMPKDELTEEMHTEFYRYIANAYDTPSGRLHFVTDAPIDINALFYFPERHMEKFGMGRQDPGVSLYCKKVLIQPKSKDILPVWLRFVKGVVDSEDIPLNISRENMQDSALIQRMNAVLTKRIIKHLDSMGKKEPELYRSWFKEFGHFVKEGVCSDFQHKDQIARLLRFETSHSEKEEFSLDDYISRMPINQDTIYYLNAPNRAFALSSPYYETFQKRGIEVIFLHSHIDDFVTKALQRYEKRAFVSIDSADVKLPKDEKAEEEEAEKEKAGDEGAVANGNAMCEYFQQILGDRLKEVKVTKRTLSLPALVVDHESTAVRKMMEYVNDEKSRTAVNKQKLEINPKHPVMIKIMAVKDTDESFARLLATQVLDNALIAADVMDNPQTMLSNLNRILEKLAKA